MLTEKSLSDMLDHLTLTQQTVKAAMSGLALADSRLEETKQALKAFYSKFEEPLSQNEGEV